MTCIRQTTKWLRRLFLYNFDIIIKESYQEKIATKNVYNHHLHYSKRSRIVRGFVIKTKCILVFFYWKKKRETRHLFSLLQKFDEQNFKIRIALYLLLQQTYIQKKIPLRYVIYKTEYFFIMTTNCGTKDCNL